MSFGETLGKGPEPIVSNKKKSVEGSKKSLEKKKPESKKMELLKLRSPLIKESKDVLKSLEEIKKLMKNQETILNRLHGGETIRIDTIPIKDKARYFIETMARSDDGSINYDKIDELKNPTLQKAVKKLLFPDALSNIDVQPMTPKGIKESPVDINIDQILQDIINESLDKDAHKAEVNPN